MIIFLMAKEEKRLCGCIIKSYYTIDDSLIELEKALIAGGFSEDEYEIHTLLGVEIK